MAANRSVEAGRAFMRLSVDDAAFNRGITKTEQRLRQFGRSAGNIGASLQGFGSRLFAGGAAVGAGLGYALKTFADFDDRARTVGAVSQATAADFARMAEQAKNLGATTSFTASQVADLQAELARAGFSPDQIIGLTSAVLDLSRATGTDTALSSGIFASAIRQFGLEAKDAGRVADALTVAANKSFNTLETLGESLTYAGPVAADLNMSLEETLAILGALGNVGIQGSNAGTALRRLGTIGAAEAAKLERIFKVPFLDAEGNARRLVDALADVGKATNALPTGERAKKFKEAFGLLGITAASAISKSVVSVGELETALNNAEGAAARTAKELDAGIGGSGRRLASAFEGIQIAGGEALGPLGQAAAANLTNTADSLRDLAKGNESAISSFAGGTGVVTAFGGALLGLGTALRFIQFSAKGFGGILGILSKIGVSANPITAAAAAVGLLGAAIAAFIRSDTAVKVAEADVGAAIPTEFFTDTDRLQAKLAAIAEQDVIDADGFRIAGNAVKALEEEFGPLGITIDQTAGKIEGLERGLALASANDVLGRSAEKIADIRKELDAVQGVEVSTTSIAQLGELEAKLRYFKQVAADAKAEIAEIGAVQVSQITGGIDAKNAASQTPVFDVKAATTLAKTIADKLEQVNLKDGAGTFGGKDLNARISGQVVRISELQLAEQKRSSTLLGQIVDAIRSNPGLVGA